MSSSGWTKQRRAKMRKAIYAWRPWEHSTGPKTPAGKAAIARNSLKHGAFTRENRQLLQGLRATLAMTTET